MLDVVLERDGDSGAVDVILRHHQMLGGYTLENLRLITLSIFNFHSEN